MARIIITGCENFGSGYGFWFLFRFTVLKNWTNFRFVCKQIFLMKKKLKYWPKRQKQAEMSKPLNNGSRSGFWFSVLMILVIVRIIITGFKDFDLGSGFWFLFRFMVLKNWTDCFCKEKIFLVKKSFLWKKFFDEKKLVFDDKKKTKKEKLTNKAKKHEKKGRSPKTIIKTVICSVQVWVFSSYQFSVLQSHV